MAKKAWALIIRLPISPGALHRTNGYAWIVHDYGTKARLQEMMTSNLMKLYHPVIIRRSAINSTLRLLNG